MPIVQQNAVDSNRTVYLFIRRDTLEVSHCKRQYKRIVVLNDLSDVEFAWACFEAFRLPDDSLIKCISVHDDYHELALTFSERLGLHYHLSRACIQNTKNKEAARGITNRLSPRPIKYLLSDRPEDICDFLEADHAKYIIKPRHGTASRNVFVVDSRTDSREQVLERLRRLGAGGWLIEEFIDGREYSVESFSHGERHLIIGVTQKGKFDGGFVESSHLFPAPLTQHEASRIHRFVSDALAALDLREGPAHTEIIINDEGVFFVESHARIGGDCIYDLVRLVTGLDFVDLITRMVLDQEISLPESLDYNGVAKIQYRHFHGDGILVDGLANREQALQVPGIVEIKDLLGRGTTTRPLGDSFDRSYYILAHTEDSEAADLAIRRADRLMKYRLQGSSL